LATATPRKRLADLAGALGKPLRDIMSQDVVVASFEIESGHEVKALNDDPENQIVKGQKVARDCVIFTLDNGSRYFSFSPSLVEKMRPLTDPDMFPLDAKFVQVETGSGQRVWDIE
jgi:hypothetical protein